MKPDYAIALLHPGEIDVRAACPLTMADETSDLVGNAWMDHADIIAPVARIDPEFFRLESQFAGTRLVLSG